MELNKKKCQCDKCREIDNLQSRMVRGEMILNAVDLAMEGKHELITDFEESFTIVRKAMDLYLQCAVRTEKGN